MTYTEILYEARERVATITLNRPDKLNAWTRTMDGEVRAAVRVAADDPGVRAIVVTGAGRGFCAGADMSLLGGIATDRAVAAHARQGQDVSVPAGDSLTANYVAAFGYLLRVGKPVIAAINGPVAGIGLCFALYCDIRLMAQGAKLTTAFARRGLVAEHGISWLLPRLIGPMNALDLLLSARTVPAAEVAQMGLVRLLPQEGFADTAHAAAVELAQLSSPRSMGVIKRQVHDAMFQSLAEAAEVADLEMFKSFGSEDFREGVSHFVEKRPPAFTGR
jgi:enoyl-CoA hydratase/carnithine racemase